MKNVKREKKKEKKKVNWGQKMKAKNRSKLPKPNCYNWPHIGLVLYIKIKPNGPSLIKTKLGGFGWQNVKNRPNRTAKHPYG